MRASIQIGMVAVAGLLMAGPARAQGPDLAKTYDQAVAALERGDEEAGLAIVNAVLARHERSGLAAYGPAFGHFYYLKGMLLIRQEQYEAAIAPLQISFERYTNEQVARGQAPNVFRAHALMQWGLCLQALKRYEEAATLFEKTLAEPQEVGPPVNQTAVRINLARCYIRTGRETEGQAILEELLGGEELDAETIQDAFTVFAIDGEEALDIQGTVRQHGSALLGSEEDQAVMNPRFAGLGARALQAGEPLRALVWYNLMTLPDWELSRLERRRQYLQARRKVSVEREQTELTERIDEVLAQLDEDERELMALYQNSLVGMASAHFQIGGFAAAYSIYELLEKRFPNAESRAGLLHNLAVCATRLELWDTAAAHAERFFREFPDHEMGIEISRLLAEVSFRRKDFESALAMGQGARTGLDMGSRSREPFDFIVAASLHHLERFEQADAELTDYLLNHPAGASREPAEFYQAITKVKLALWEEAIPLLEGFAEGRPDSPYTPVILYFSSLAHLAVEKPYEALIRANQIITRYPESERVAEAFNVRGDVQGMTGASYDDVMASYQQARLRSDERTEEGQAAEAYALKQMVTTAASFGRHEETMKHYETLRERYPESRWMVDAARAVAESHRLAGDLEAGRFVLEDVSQNAFSQGRDGFGEAFQAYRAFLEEHFGAGEAMAALEAFPGAGSDPFLDSWLVTGKLEILESSEAPVPEGEFEDQYVALEEAFERHGTLLGAYPRVRLARWLAEERHEEAGAAKIYDAIIEVAEPGPALGWALLERAKRMARSDDPGVMEQATGVFLQVRGGFDDIALQEAAVLGLGRFASERGKWAMAEELWGEYLDMREWTEARPEAGYLYAQSLEAGGRLDEAVKGYVAVYTNYPGQLDWSTEAYLRASSILWRTDRRRNALVVLQEMLRLMKGREHPNIERAKEVFFTWRDEYAASLKRP